MAPMCHSLSLVHIPSTVRWGLSGLARREAVDLLEVPLLWYSRSSDSLARLLLRFYETVEQLVSMRRWKKKPLLDAEYGMAKGFVVSLLAVLSFTPS